MSRSRFLPAAVLALVLVSPAAAQFEYVAIKNARVGFRPGTNVNETDTTGAVWVAKRSQWTPLSFELEVLRKWDPRKPPLPMKLQVESRDADETPFTVFFPLGTPLNGFTPPPTDPTGTDTTAPVKWTVKSVDLPLRGAARPGGGRGDVTLTILSDDGSGERLSDPVKVEGLQLRDPSVYVVLGLGSRLPGFDLTDNGNRAGQATRRGLRGGRVETAVFDTVAEMPDDWFVYEGADLVVLPTGASQQNFLEELFDPDKSKPFLRKREALTEWVRRGGKLLVSVGREADKLKQYPALLDLLPAKLTGSAEVRSRNLVYPSSGGGAGGNLSLSLTTTDPETKELKRNQPFRVATLERRTDRPALALMTDSGNGAVGNGPLVTAQMSLGLGRVTAVGVDLDAAPFTALDKGTRQGLWDWFVRNAGSEKAAEERNRPDYSTGLSPVDMEDGAVAAVRRHVDEFEGVPVISFGWVALFILLYTLLIGPVEYLFLKKILGRLELTWVTFPVIVLSVSAAAYFTAYAIKGKDLRVNKIDVVDIDVHGQRVYGRTWFTVFSPRVDSYTVGIEPKAPWAAEPVYGTPTPPSMVDWLGGIRPGTGGAGGFRSYRYELDGTGKRSSGLAGVPIQVWSTKAFVANWSGAFDPAKPPVTADLTHPPANPKAATGKITVNLPLGNIQQGFAFFAGKAYRLAALPDGQPVLFDSAKDSVGNWADSVDLFDPKFSSDDMYDDFGGRRTSRTAGVSAAGPLSLWGILLSDHAVKQKSRAPQNSSVRTLDQSWRLDPRNTEEVMIVVKLARAPQPAPAGQPKAEPPKPPSAEELMTDPASVSPTKLWLRAVPGSGPREPVPGLLTQETYVRIFVPVKAAGK